MSARNFHMLTYGIILLVCSISLYRNGYSWYPVAIICIVFMTVLFLLFHKVVPRMKEEIAKENEAQKMVDEMFEADERIPDCCGQKMDYEVLSFHCSKCNNRV